MDCSHYLPSSTKPSGYVLNYVTLWFQCAAGSTKRLDIDMQELLYPAAIVYHVITLVLIMCKTLVGSGVELEQGCLFLHGSNIPSPTAQTVLCAPSKSQPVCPGLGIYEHSESKASGLGSLIKNYSSPWPRLGSHIYTLSGA